MTYKRKQSKLYQISVVFSTAFHHLLMALVILSAILNYRAVPTQQHNMQLNFFLLQERNLVPLEESSNKTKQVFPSQIKSSHSKIQNTD